MVAKIDKSIAHNSAYPKLTPAMVQTVTVPGPIKAAATKAPGPIFLNKFFNVNHMSMVKIHNLHLHTTLIHRNMYFRPLITLRNEINF
jgi:hypothetical protein